MELTFTNYRPISRLCIASKVLERLIYDEIIDFVQPQLSKYQFGILTNRSCLHKFLLILSNIVQVLNGKSQLDVLLLDFQKSFDTVSHQELLSELSMLGITGGLLDWFAGYLTEKVYKVSLEFLLLKCSAGEVRSCAGKYLGTGIIRLWAPHPYNNTYKFRITCIVMYSSSTAFL